MNVRNMAEFKELDLHKMGFGNHENATRECGFFNEWRPEKAEEEPK